MQDKNRPTHMTNTTGDKNSRALSSSPLPRRLHKIGLALIQAGQRGNPKNPELEKAGREFLRTGKLKMRALQAIVKKKPQALSPSVQNLKRGEWVTVLDIQGSWYRIRTEQGREGFLPSNKLIPRTFTLRPGRTLGGSNAKDTGTIAGRG